MTLPKKNRIKNSENIEDTNNLENGRQENDIEDINDNTAENKPNKAASCFTSSTMVSST